LKYEVAIGGHGMKKFKLNEILFISLIVATVFALGYILIPLMLMVPLPAYKAIVVAPIYSAAVTLIMIKIKKRGTITLLGLLLGMILSMFTVLMLLIATCGGLITDIIIRLFNNIPEKNKVAIASGLFPAVQIPITFIVMAYTVGGSFGELLRKPLIIVIPAIIAFAIGYATSSGIQGVMEKRKLSEVYEQSLEEKN